MLLQCIKIYGAFSTVTFSKSTSSQCQKVSSASGIFTFLSLNRLESRNIFGASIKVSDISKSLEYQRAALAPEVNLQSLILKPSVIQNGYFPSKMQFSAMMFFVSFNALSPE